MWQFKNTDDLSTPVWDEASAASKIGAYCVIGVTEKRGEEVVNQYQMHGRIREITRDGVIFDLEGSRKGQTYNLPADERGFKTARQGNYKFRATGEIVENPDFELSWTVNLNPRSAN
jgi:hypothetical protein